MIVSLACLICSFRDLIVCSSDSSYGLVCIWFIDLFVALMISFLIQFLLLLYPLMLFCIFNLGIDQLFYLCSCWLAPAWYALSWWWLWFKCFNQCLLLVWLLRLVPKTGSRKAPLKPSLLPVFGVLSFSPINHQLGASVLPLHLCWWICGFRYVAFGPFDAKPVSRCGYP